MALELYTLIICEIILPKKASEIKYVHFADITASIPDVEGHSIIQYLKETHNYPENAIIKIKDIIVLKSKEEFNKYL